MKQSASLAVWVVAIVLSRCRITESTECTQVSLTGAEVINMCANETRMVQAPFLSASSAEMGDGTRCTCTLVALSPSSNSSYFAPNQVARVSNCTAVLTVESSSMVQYTCQSFMTGTPVPLNASNVTIEVLRNGSVDFGFCLAIINTYINNPFNLTCENDAPFQETTTLPATGPTMLTSLLLSTSTPGSLTPLSQTTSSGAFSLSTSSVSTSSDTTSFSSTSTPFSSVSPTTTTSASTSAGSEASSKVYGNVPSSTGTAAVTKERSTITLHSTTPAESEEPESAFPIIPVAAGVAGGLFLLILVIIVIACIRRKRKAHEKALQQTSEINKSLPGFSSVHLEDNILYESSSAWTAGEAPKTGGATQPLEGGAGGGGTSGQTSGHLGRGQYLGPAGDVYSLVQKAGEDGCPGHLQSAQLRSTPDLDSTEVLQGDADDPAPDGPADGSSTADHDSASGSLQSPRMHHVKLEIAQGVEQKRAVSFPRDEPAATEYTTIDHDATKNIWTAL